MEKRELGKSGIAIAPLVFGGNVFGWTADQQRSFELVDRFTERGFNAIDTADVYRTGRRASRAVNRKPSSANGWRSGAAATTWC